MYAKMVRSLVKGGPGGRLGKAEVAWLAPYYSGDTDRFAAAIAADKLRPTPVFDVCLHVRTLELIEGTHVNARGQSEVHVVPGAERRAKAAAFLESAPCEAMIRCLARNVVDEVLASRCVCFFFGEIWDLDAMRI